VTRFVPDFEAVRPTIVEQFDGSALRAFRDCHRGRRCFILGNGPSLQRTDLAPLADEITFGVNGIFYMTHQCGFAPTYYVVEDNHVFADNLERIEAVEATARFFPSKYRPIIAPSPGTYFLPTDWSFYWGSSEWYETPRFSHDVAEVIFAGQTVTFLNIQLATYMGCSEIYLVGIDFEYHIPAAAKVEGLTITSTDDDPNHFHPDYFGKGKRWHLPKLDNVERAMECAKVGVEEAGARIFNATIGGKLEVFERADYHAVVGRPPVTDPNSAPTYLLTRGLEHARLKGASTMTVDLRSRDAGVADILDASPLCEVQATDADVVVTDRVPDDFGTAGDRRYVVLADRSNGTEDPAQPVGWLAKLLVHSVATRRSTFWSRSVLELSPDGESSLIPGLGRAALVAFDPRRTYGATNLDNLDARCTTRWVDGTSLSPDDLATLAEAIVRGGHTFAVVDGYIYVQSRWAPSTRPAASLTAPTIEGDTARAVWT
jgi:hypothetical protein